MYFPSFYLMNFQIDYWGTKYEVRRKVLVSMDSEKHAEHFDINFFESVRGLVVEHLPQLNLT